MYLCRKTNLANAAGSSKDDWKLSVAGSQELACSVISHTCFHFEGISVAAMCM
jgi:hypothetical protein